MTYWFHCLLPITPLSIVFWHALHVSLATGTPSVVLGWRATNSKEASCPPPDDPLSESDQKLPLQQDWIPLELAPERESVPDTPFLDNSGSPLQDVEMAHV